MNSKLNMDTYNFNGDWEFNLKLPFLSKIHSDYWRENKRPTELQKILEAGYVPFCINGERTYDPDPTESQTNAIQYLINSEEEICQFLFHTFIYEINPKHKEWFGEDFWIPDLTAFEDLGKLARINSINVLTEQKEGYSYVKVNFDYLGDVEHGLSIIIHKLSLLDYGGIGDLNHDCIYKDLGLKPDDVYEEMRETSKLGADMVHSPLAKYNKFKPWQLEAVSDYFSKLLWAKHNELIISEIESYKWDINLRLTILEKNLIDMAAYSNNIEMLAYLIHKGGDTSDSMEQCVSSGFFHKEAIEYLVSQGVSIDFYTWEGVSLLYHAIMNFAHSINNLDYYTKGKDEKMIEHTKAQMKEQIIKIQYFISLGANPNKLTKTGKGYKEVLKLRYNEDYLIEKDIFGKVETIIFTDK